jgi:hypothetical protein
MPVETCGGVHLVPRQHGLRTIQKLLIQFVVVIAQVGLLNIICGDHLDEAFHLIEDQVVNLGFGGTRIQYCFIESFLQVGHFRIEDLPIHILAEELHHALKAVGDEDLVVSFLNTVPDPTHYVPEAE